MKIKDDFLRAFMGELGHTPTGSQVLAMRRLCDFLADSEKLSVFLLRGYAGTGKTTLISALIKALDSFHVASVLMAPTGRAAKVLTSYSGKPAFTIHKCIYRKKSTKQVDSRFSLNYNGRKDTLFIVDEASMIGDATSFDAVFGSGRLLSDLLTFVYNDANCRLLLVGDTAQLPPVGTLASPALDKANLEAMGFVVYEEELSDVVRQEAVSGILANATSLRHLITAADTHLPILQVDGCPDIHVVDSYSLLEDIESCFSQFGENETKIICRSNKAGVQYNIGIRNRIMWKEEEIVVGDLLMVVKNNYVWLPENAEMDFIANGDMVRVQRVGSRHEKCGYRFVDLRVEFVDYPDLEIDVLALMDTLTSNTPAMPPDYYQTMYDQLQVEYSHIADLTARREAILADPFLNALQVKFAYAMTCHKAQGGQWRAIFIDYGYVDFQHIDNEGVMAFNRWLYTAITRATEKLFLINCGKILPS